MTQLDVFSSTDDRACPCGFVRWGDAFTPQWHRDHRAQHLAVFPNVDQGTRDNLDMFIEQAESKSNTPKGES